MARFFISAALVALAAQVVSADDAVECGDGSPCPEATPCCSQYGQCGVGAYCLGGCDPLHSFGLDSCVPAPVCQNRNVKFTDMDRLVSNTEYLGDADSADFVYSGEPLIYDDQVLLTMPANSVGTLLTSTAYMWYGKTSATFKTSGGQGVVTAFILLSDVKDEIDFEFVGYNLTQAQTNFYWQGVLDYNNGGNSSVPGGNSMRDSHTYTIDWQVDTLTWSIDGNVVRTLDKASTWNATSNSYSYPQTPSRVELSVWPAGAASNPEGTIEWAGGVIDWNNTDYMVNGYYWAAFSEVTMECYDPPTGANASGDVSYIYTDISGLNNSVAITDDKTILKSFLGTGTDMDAGAASGTASSAAATATVPGEVGTGTGSSGDRGSGSNSDGSSSSSSGSASASTGFVQGGGSTNAGAAVTAHTQVLVAGLLTAGAAIVGMLAL